MIAEAFNEGWIENNGEQPVEDGVFVDVVWSDGSKDFNYDAEYWRWAKMKVCDSIVYWREHVPEITLPKPTRPAPPKQESTPINPAIVPAFNAMTGQDLTDDQLQTLTILLKHFQK